MKSRKKLPIPGAVLSAALEALALMTPKAWGILIIVVLALMPFAYVGCYRLYTLIDQTQFPAVSEEVRARVAQTGPDAAEAEKGAALAYAMLHQLKYELDSTFGWTVNDMLPTRWLDNRGNRQRGVIFATRMLQKFYSINLAKYGEADQENNDLKQARERLFAFDETAWGFLGLVYAAENKYREGIGLVEKYMADATAGRATFNMRSDDIYNLLTFIIGGELLDQPMGLLAQTNERVSFFELDDRVEYAKGVVLVVRDFLYALTELYPEIMNKGGEENIKIAFREINQICTFDPYIVLRGEHDSLFADHRGKVARYLLNVEKRLRDVAESIRR